MWFCLLVMVEGTFYNERRTSYHERMYSASGGGKAKKKESYKCECDHECSQGKYCKIPFYQLDGSKFYPCAKNQHRYPRFHCAQGKPNSSICKRDKQCQSGMCRTFKCVECDSDYHCSYGYYCYGMDNPLVVNKCVRKQKSGFCGRSAQCEGQCLFFFCW